MIGKTTISALHAFIGQTMLLRLTNAIREGLAHVVGVVWSMGDLHRDVCGLATLATCVFFFYDSDKLLRA